MNAIDELVESQRQRIKKLGAEVERLKSLVATLPKTADGVAITPKMRIWREEWPTTLGEVVLEVDGENRARLDGMERMYSGSELFSTLKAAGAPGGKR